MIKFLISFVQKAHLT